MEGARGEEVAPRHFPRNNTLDFLFGGGGGGGRTAAAAGSPPSILLENQEGSKMRYKNSTPSMYAIDFIRKCEGETIIVYKTSRYLCANCSKIFQSKCVCVFVLSETYHFFNRADVPRGDTDQPYHRPQGTGNAARIAQEGPRHFPWYPR